MFEFQKIKFEGQIIKLKILRLNEIHRLEINYI